MAAWAAIKGFTERFARMGAVIDAEVIIATAAPDTSNPLPIMTPKPMTISMLLKVLPKPVVIDFATFTSPTDGGIPPINHVNDAAIIRAGKAWIFVFYFSF